MGNIHEITKKLTQLVKENPNTQKGIKRAIEKLEYTTEHIAKERDVLLSLSAAQLPEAQKKLVDSTSQTNADEDIRLLREENARITKENEKLKARLSGAHIPDEQDELSVAEITREITECGNDEDFQVLAGKPWPESVYTHSVIRQEDPILGEKDLALYAPGGDMKKGKIAQAAARFPELADTGKNCQTDYVGSLLHATSIRDGQSVSKKERMIYKVVPAAIDGRDTILELTQTVRSLREQMDIDGRNTVVLLRPPEIPITLTRKVTEYIFRDTEKRIELYEPALRRPGPGRPPTEATVVVKAGEKSFTEALKDVKQRLNDSDGVKLKAVKKTQKGDILLIVKGGLDGAKILEDKIRTKTGMAAYVRDGAKKTLLIQGLDGVTTKEEIMAAVQDHLKCADQSGFSVTSLRSTRRDNQTATLVATIDIAERLLTDGRLYIGWLECRVKERIDLPKCFKCLEYGHTRTSCKGPNREDTCFKCGKPGHMAKDCTDQVEFCHACQREGHRSSSTNCPIFRKMISEARGRARFGRGNMYSKATNR